MVKGLCKDKHHLCNKKQRQQQKGPLDLFLSTKPKVSNQKDAKGKQTTIESHVNKELRENACVCLVDGCMKRYII